jgi:hypothetical protein
LEFWIFFSIPIVIFVLFFAVTLFLKRSRRLAAIAGIKNGRGILSTWKYTPDEWNFAAENHFKLRTQSGESGQVSFTAQNIYISNGRKDILLELVGEKKYVKHLTSVYLFKDTPMNLIKFEVRKKIIKQDQDGNETEKCTVEEFYVPIPSNYQTETDKIIKFYENILDNNADAVAAVMPYGLGMFGR